MGRIRKPRLSFQIEPLDRKAIDAALEHFPGVSPSFLLRAALRVGLAAVVKDRALIATPVVTIPPAPPGRRAR
jgi:hypothetical protein